MKTPGHCSACGRRLFEIFETFPSGHPFEGTPRRLSGPEPDAVRAHLILADGSLCVMTICEAHIEDLPALLPGMWRDMLARMRAERKAHREFGQKDFDPEQHAHADATNLALVDNVPLGLLTWERWNEHGSQ